MAIVALVFSLVLTKSSSYQFWKQEAAVRRLVELIRFLHYQAIADQAFYRLEFDLNNPELNNLDTYRVGRLVPDAFDEPTTPSAVTAAAALGANQIEIELADFLNPSIGQSYYMIAPLDYPNLFEPVRLPEDFEITWVRTMYTELSRNEGGKIWVDFNPRGFSDFAVIHLTLINGAPRTIVINPFTGLTEVYNEHRELEWTYGRAQS